MTYAEWLVNTMYDMAQQCATHYREQSRTHNLRYPSTVAFAIDVTQPTRTGYGVGGWGWGWPCQIGGHDIKRGGHYDTPADAFAQLAPELGTTLRQTVGVRWDALNCAEVRAVNDLLTDHPEAALQSLYVACFWLSNGAPAQPCHSCTRWIDRVFRFWGQH